MLNMGWDESDLHERSAPRLIECLKCGNIGGESEWTFKNDRMVCVRCGGTIVRLVKDGAE